MKLTFKTIFSVKINGSIRILIPQFKWKEKVEQIWGEFKLQNINKKNFHFSVAKTTLESLMSCWDWVIFNWGCGYIEKYVVMFVWTIRIVSFGHWAYQPSYLAAFWSKVCSLIMKEDRRWSPTLDRQTFKGILISFMIREPTLFWQLLSFFWLVQIQKFF